MKTTESTSRPRLSQAPRGQSVAKAILVLTLLVGNSLPASPVNRTAPPAGAKVEEARGARAELAALEKDIAAQKDALKALSKGTDEQALARRVHLMAALRAAEEAKATLHSEKFDELAPEKAEDLRRLQKSLAETRTDKERSDLINLALALDAEFAAPDSK